MRQATYFAGIRMCTEPGSNFGAAAVTTISPGLPVACTTIATTPVMESISVAPLSSLLDPLTSNRTQGCASGTTVPSASTTSASMKLASSRSISSVPFAAFTATRTGFPAVRSSSRAVYVPLFSINWIGIDHASCTILPGSYMGANNMTVFRGEPKYHSRAYLRKPWIASRSLSARSIALSAWNLSRAFCARSSSPIFR